MMLRKHLTENFANISLRSAKRPTQGSKGPSLLNG